MNRDDRFADWLVRWEAASTARGERTLAEICAEAPEHEADFRKLLGNINPLNDMLLGEGHVSEAEHLPRINTGRYTAERYHDGGGLGEVFVARDAEIGRKVALKCMRPLQAIDGASRRQFLAEAEITGKLEHPGIVPVYGLGKDDNGQPYYAMRFIEGRNLDEEIKSYFASSEDRNVALRRLLRHFVAVCETMAYAHHRGIVHRDIKPANIMIGPYGETLVVDWGLARQVGEADFSPRKSPTFQPLPHLGETLDSSITGFAKGSPAFMSPEQARGETGLGPLSDIFSLGSTLYVILTGRRPYIAASAREIIALAAKGAFVPPREVSSSVPAGLDAICRKAMSLRPADRYQEAKALAGDIERWLADEPVSAGREPFSIRARRWLRRHRTLVTSSVAMLLVALFATIALAVQERQSNRDLADRNTLLDSARGDLVSRNIDLTKATKRAEEATEQAISDRDRADANRLLAEERLHRFMSYLTSDALAKYEYGRAAGYLVKSAPEPGDRFDLRQFSWYRAWHSMYGAPRRTMKVIRHPYKIQMSADGRILVAKSSTATVVYRTATGEAMLRLPGSFNDDFFLPPHGKWLVFHEHRVIETWLLPAEGPAKAGVTITPFTDLTENLFTVCGNGETCATIDRSRVLRMWNLRDGKKLSESDRFVPKKGDYRSPFEGNSLSGDGQWLILQSLTQPSVLLHIPSGTEIKPEVYYSDDGYALAGDEVKKYALLTFNNAKRLYVKYDKTLVSWPLPEPSDELRVNPFKAGDARRQKIDQSFVEFWEYPVEGEDPLMFLSTGTHALGMRWPVTFEEQTIISGIRPQPRRVALPGVPFGMSIENTLSAFSVRPDGKVLIFAEDDGRVTMLDSDPATEPELAMRHQQEWGIAGMFFLPDGSLTTLSRRNGLTRGPIGGKADWYLPPEPFDVTKFASLLYSSIARSPDGRWVALRLRHGVEVINANQIDDTCHIDIKQFSITGCAVPLAFVPGKDWIVLATERNDGPRTNSLQSMEPSDLIVWDFGKSKQILAATGAIGGGPALAASARTGLLTSIKGINARVPVTHVAVSPDGRWIAAAGKDDVLRIHGLSADGTISPQAKFSYGTARSKIGWTALCFAPDSRSIVAGKSNGQILWADLDGGPEPPSIPAHTGSVTSLLFDPSGKTLVSGSDDGRVKFLNRELPYELFTIVNGTAVRSLAFAPDGRGLAVGDSEGNVRIYRAGSPQSVLDAARARLRDQPDSDPVIRQFLQALWGRYLAALRGNEANARSYVQEALKLTDELHVKQQAGLKLWIDAFRKELEQ